MQARPRVEQRGAGARHVAPQRRGVAHIQSQFGHFDLNLDAFQLCFITSLTIFRTKEQDRIAPTDTLLLKRDRKRPDRKLLQHTYGAPEGFSHAADANVEAAAEEYVENLLQLLEHDAHEEYKRRVHSGREKVLKEVYERAKAVDGSIYQNMCDALPWLLEYNICKRCCVAQSSYLT